MKKISFTTSIPSPYQVELFDALAASGRVCVSVLYERQSSAQRLWEAPRISHDHLVLTEAGLTRSAKYLNGSDLVVFSGYQCRAIRKLISTRQRAGKPWAFWGERPGFLMPPLIGRAYRRLFFGQIHREKAPVWGIGTWAVEAYRRELGGERLYCNVPYFSRLAPFLAVDRSTAIGAPRRLLFSGSLIKRKGVDVLLEAFRVVAPEFPDLELHFVGDGALRGALAESSRSLNGRVVFHGFKQWEELPRYYGDADILCAPSRHDGWGLIVPEGLAAGLLVVSTDRTGAALDLIDRGVDWRVAAGSVEALIGALREAASTSGPERLRRIAAGRSRAAAFDVNVGVDTILAAIELSLSEYCKK